MEKKFVTLDRATKEFRKLFDVVEAGEKPGSTDGNFQYKNTFYIHKGKMMRHEVLNKLSEWFDTKLIKDHYVEISPITLLWTTFKIKKNG